jgi:DNA invertase Pin-like site-specific DNA recombinase
MLIGYARISTADQGLNLQRDALLAAGCPEPRVYTDIASGAKADRPGLEAALHDLREGDTLVVWKLDRLGRSLKHLIETVHALDARGVGFKSLQEHIDTTTPGGKLIFHVFAALAEFERDLIGERTRAGLTAARARGRRGGRKHALTPKQAALAKSMKADPHNSIADICATLGISKCTLYRYTGEQNAEAE